MEWRFGWTVVGQWFTSHEIVEGLKITLEATVLAMILGHRHRPAHRGDEVV